MAEGFDAAKASSDIKQLLKFNDGLSCQVKDKHNIEKESRTKKKKKSKKLKCSQDGSGNRNSQQNGVSDKSDPSTNSSSNALVSVISDNSIESKQQSHRGSPTYSCHPQVLKIQKHDSSGQMCSEARPNSNDNASVEKSSDVKHNKSSHTGNRSLNDPSNFAQKMDTTVQLKQLPASRNQNKVNEVLKNGGQPTTNATNGLSSGSSKDGGRTGGSINARNNGQSQKEKPGEKQNNKENGKPRPSKSEEMELSPAFLELLEENQIYFLKKKSMRFPKANFFCRLCDYHLDLKEDCDKHLKDSKHCRRKEVSKIESDLRNMEKPTENQIAAVTVALEKVQQEHGMDETEKKQRADVVCRLQRLLKEKIPDVIMFMYGSSLTQLGLKTADINVDLTSAQKDKKLPSLLKDVFSRLQNCPDAGFSDVRSDFAAKIPGVLLTDDSTGLTVNITIHCYSAHCTSELLSTYSNLDSRVQKLAVAFRYWAHLCGLDRQCDGFIPPHALNIMVIYFLQNTNPKVIQVIQPPLVTGDEIGDFRNDSAKFEKLRIKAMEEVKTFSNSKSVGELWLELLKFYSLDFDTANFVVSIRGVKDLSRSSKPWNSKRLAVEDPYILKKNITRMAGNSRIYEYWQDSLRKAYYYFGRCRNKDGILNGCEQDTMEKTHPSKASVISQATKELGENTETIVQENTTGPVIIAPNPLLSNSSTLLKKGDVKESEDHRPQAASSCVPHVRSDLEAGVCRQTEQLSLNGGDVAYTKTSSSSSSTTLHDKDKSSNFSESCTVPSSTTAEPVIQYQHNSELLDVSEAVRLHETSQPADICQCLQKVHKAGVHELTNQFAHSVVNKALCEVSKDKLHACGDNKGDQTCLEIRSSHCDGICDKSSLTTALSKTEKDARPTAPTLQHSLCETCGKHRIHKKVAVMDSSAENSHLSDLSIKLCSDASTKETVEDETKTMNKQLSNEEKSASVSCHYEFSKENLTNGKGPTLVCSYCEKEGHLKNDCPEDELPEILPLPKLTDFHVDVLSKTLSKLPAEVGLSYEGLKERIMFMRDLEEFIRVQFRDANLELFGSSCNGFGFDRSDMDICLTFSRRQISEKSYVIETLARRMKQQLGELTNVQAISTAKVPIVKFTIKRTGLEGDISLSNILAQQNTKLLLCYSKIDPRVRILGYTIKTFAKVCDIGDASRGSLSSYAYILMMLYYLQQVTPPVIPVLQELYVGKVKPHLVIEEWDAWFMDDLSQLEKLWPEKGKNKMSVAELWLGFLCFYVEKFSCKEHVVSIRQKELLTRFEKLWNGSCITIEDPFDLSHNLGSGLTRKMNNFIFKTFINGRMLYGSPIDDNIEMFNKYQSPSDYFFDTDLLSECRPPNVRGCRRCGKIGHLVRHCPGSRKDKEDEQKQRLQQQYSPQHQGQGQKQQQQQQLGYLQKLSQQQLSQQQYHRHLQQQQHQRSAQQQRQPQQQQQNQLQKQQMQQQRERLDRRDRDSWRSDPVNNTNKNSSTQSNAAQPQLFNFANHPNLSPTTPAVLRGLQPQVFHNRGFSQQQQQFQQHSLSNSPARPLQSFMPQTFMPSMPRYPMNVFDCMPQLQARPDAFHQLGYPSMSPGFSNYYQQSNSSNQRGPHAQYNAQSSGYSADVSSTSSQGMNPVVQNLFASARGQVLDVNSNQANNGSRRT